MPDTTIVTTLPTGHRLIRASEEAAMRLEPLLDRVPEAGGDDDSILLAILATSDPDDIDAPWRGQGMRSLAGEQLTIHGIRWARSAFPEGLGIFLICDVTLADGERTVVTTGSKNIVAQLVMRHLADAWPVTVTVVEDESRTNPGRKPMHLEVVR